VRFQLLEVLLVLGVGLSQRLLLLFYLLDELLLEKLLGPHAVEVSIPRMVVQVLLGLLKYFFLLVGQFEVSSKPNLLPSSLDGYSLMTLACSRIISLRKIVKIL
jgi:hypothetical protein